LPFALVLIDPEDSRKVWPCVHLVSAGLFLAGAVLGLGRGSFSKHEEPEHTASRDDENEKPEQQMGRSKQPVVHELFLR
jgi:hypothetical protein